MIVPPEMMKGFLLCLAQFPIHIWIIYATNRGKPVFTYKVKLVFE
jgi:hypothetical protein